MREALQNELLSDPVRVAEAEAFLDSLPDLTACGLCGRDPAIGDQVIDDEPFCHWSPAMGATCYTAQQARNAGDARRAVGIPVSSIDVLGIIPTQPDDRPCVQCRGAGNTWCAAGKHVYCDLHVGRGCVEGDYCAGCACLPPSDAQGFADYISAQIRRRF